MKRQMMDYRLPDGRIVQIDEDVARGSRFVSFTLVGGEVVQAESISSDECPKCSRVGRGPLCKWHRVEPVDVVSVDLADHGEFKARLSSVVAMLASHRTEAVARRELARRMAGVYEGVEAGEASTPKYWSKYSAWVLAIVYCGCVEPLN